MKIKRALLQAGFVSFLFLTIDAGAQSKEQPNILFVVSDDLNTRIGPLVDSSLKIHTPNLDRLASEGISFTRAYCQWPVCAPSRAAFMSGLYPETNGVTRNSYTNGNHRTATPALADHPTLAGFLRERGYYTARVSKIFHMGVPGGIERGEAGPDDPDSWDYAINLMAPETLTPGHLEKLSAGFQFGANFSRMILEDGEDLTQADVLAANQAIAILENRAKPSPVGATNRTKFKEGAPFFLAVGFVRPHVPLIAPKRHFKLYPDEEAAIPYVPDGDLDDVPEQATRNSNNSPRFQMNEMQKRKSIAAYHASISFMDEQLGRLLDALDRLKLRNNTVVIFFSDHGFNMGEHDCWQKSSLWEESVRVPLIISVPGMRHRGTETETIAELNDLYPTLAELSGLDSDSPALLQGQSLVPFLNAPDKTDPDQFAYTVTAQSGASLRTDRWRYNRWGAGADGSNEELYDHHNDPHEFRNLANDPGYASALRKVRSQFEQARAMARGIK